MNGKRFLKLRKYAVIAALVFWIPDVTAHIVSHDRLAGLTLLWLTILLPVLTCFVVAYIWKASGDIGRFLPVGWAAVFGIWLFGPVMMLVNASFSSVHFFHPGWSQEIVLGTLFFPITTWVGSAYDGSLGALVLATAALPLMSLRLKHQSQLGPLPHAK